MYKNSQNQFKNQGKYKTCLREVNNMQKTEYKEKIPVKQLYQQAYVYCQQSNHIDSTLPEKRVQRFIKQSQEVWEHIEDVNAQVIMLPLSETQVRQDFLKSDWIEANFGDDTRIQEVYLYAIYIQEKLPEEKTTMLKFMQNTWCEGFLLAANDWMMKKMTTSDKESPFQVRSVVAGIDGIPNEALGEWIAYLNQFSDSVKINEDGTVEPFNSLVGLYICSR